MFLLTKVFLYPFNGEYLDLDLNTCITIGNRSQYTHVNYYLHDFKQGFLPLSISFITPILFFPNNLICHDVIIQTQSSFARRTLMLLTVSGKKFCHPTEAFFSCKKQKRICCSTFFSKVFIIIIIFLDSSHTIGEVVLFVLWKVL